MTPEDAARLRGVLDRLVKEKEIAASWFGRVAQVLDDVDQRRAFRRMAQGTRRKSAYASTVAFYRATGHAWTRAFAY